MRVPNSSVCWYTQRFAVQPDAWRAWSPLRPFTCHVNLAQSIFLALKFFPLQNRRIFQKCCWIISKSNCQKAPSHNHCSLCVSCVVVMVIITAFGVFRISVVTHWSSEQVPNTVRCKFWGAFLWCGSRNSEDLGDLPLEGSGKNGRRVIAWSQERSSPTEEQTVRRHPRQGCGLSPQLSALWLRFLPALYK